MKLRRFIYIAAIILITFGINKHITYSFEVKEKARTYSTLQIGKGTGSYSLPSTAGNPGDVLWINENREVTWKYVIPKWKLTFSEPLLTTEDKCNDKVGLNKFLPLNPYYKPKTKGYCIATLDGTWDGVLKYQDKNNKIQEGGIIAHDVGRYCDVYYEQAYSLPPGFINQLWDAITSRLPKDRYWDKFKPLEQEAILAFVKAVTGKKIYLSQFNYYETGTLNLSMFIIGGFRLTNENLTDFPNPEKLSVADQWAKQQFPLYEGSFWDGSLPLASMVLTQLKAFCGFPPNYTQSIYKNETSCKDANNYFYTSVYAMCVR